VTCFVHAFKVMTPQSCVRTLSFVPVYLHEFRSCDTAAFDLSGPRIEVKVTRGGKTLPFRSSELGSPQPPPPPPGRSGPVLRLSGPILAHYLLIAAFSRPTNPRGCLVSPRRNLEQKGTRRGAHRRVPQDAQQPCCLAPRPWRLSIVRFHREG